MGAQLQTHSPACIIADYFLLLVWKSVALFVFYQLIKLRILNSGVSYLSILESQFSELREFLAQNPYPLQLGFCHI